MYKYDKLVEPPGPDIRDMPVTSTVNLQPIRALTYWIDEIHGRERTLHEDGTKPTAPSPITTAGCE